jgi:hypothetical protein
MSQTTSLDIREIGFGDAAVEYQAGWDLQKEIHADVVGGLLPDTVLLLEHQSVYTAGRRTEDFERPFDGTPVVDVDRGGKITWHGLGQLVGYPIVRLPDPIDVIAHVRRIETMLIEVCAEFGVTSSQVKGRSGVWVTADDRGFFTIQGLKPGRHYQLIARTKEGTRVFSGAVVASPPNPRLTIFLSEDVQPGEVPALPAPDLLPIKPKGATGSGPVARLMNPLAVPGTAHPFNPNPDPAPVPSATPGETARNDQGNSSGSLITSPISIGDSPKAAPAPIATNPNGGPPVLVMPAMPAGQALASQPPAPIPPSAPNATNTPVSAPTLIMPVAPPTTAIGVWPQRCNRASSTTLTRQMKHSC